MAYLARGNGFQVAAGKGDEGLVGGVVPVDGGLDLGLEIAAGEEGVEDADPVEVEAVGVGREVLEEVGEGFRGGKAPEMLFPRRDEATDFFIGFEGVLEAGADVATVDAGDPGGIRIVGAREAGERLGENSRGIRIGRGNALFHKVLKAAAKDGKDGEGAVGKEEIAEDLQPDDHKFNGVFALEGLDITDERERAAGGKGVVK